MESQGIASSLRALSDDELLHRTTELVRCSRRTEADLVAHIGVARLAAHLTPENRDTVLARAVHRSKREVEELIAELWPRPDAPAVIRKLPEPLAARRQRGAEPPAAGPLAAAGELVALLPSGELGLERVGAELGLERVAAAVSARPGPSRRTGSIEPIAPSRYRVQFTARAALKEKLERLQALTRSTVRDDSTPSVSWTRDEAKAK